MIRWYHVFGVAVGMASGGGAWLLADSLALAVAVGIVWATAVAVTGHGHATQSDGVARAASLGESWTFARWIILCLIPVYASSYVVGNVLPLPAGPSFALALLMFGLGALGFATGYLCARDEWGLRLTEGASVERESPGRSSGG